MASLRLLTRHYYRLVTCRACKLPSRRPSSASSAPTNGTSLQLRLLLASDRTGVGRLLKMVSQPPPTQQQQQQNPPQGIAPHVARRAAQIILNLAESPASAMTHCAPTSG